MNVLYSAAANTELYEIIAYTKIHFPGSSRAVEEAIRSTIERIALWPESARKVTARPAVHVVPVTRYPFLVFYRIELGQIQILSIRHAARRP